MGSKKNNRKLVSPMKTAEALEAQAADLMKMNVTECTPYVLSVKSDVEAGEYDNDDRLDAAIDAMLDGMFGKEIRPLYQRVA